MRSLILNSELLFNVWRRPVRYLLSVHCLVVLIWMASSHVNAQTIKVRGQFLVDSIQIGKPFPYSLTAEYPSTMRVLFPDSTFQFTPFEFADKQYFPTVSTNGISRDSAVYYLASYEIDSLQALALPIYVLEKQDCTEVRATQDFAWLQHLVSIRTDSIEANNLPLKVNTFYEPVAWLFNYPLVVIGCVVLLVLLIGAWLIFGKRIQQYFKARRMRKAFEQFAHSFVDSIDTMKSNYSVKSAERALTLWKQYLENLEGKPLTKLTSKEIIRSTGNDALGTSLKTVDRLLYAGAQPNSLDAFYELKSYSEDRFHQKLEELKSPAK